VANAFKFIPGAGTIIGGIISGTTASIVTSALALSYIEVLSIIATKEKEGESLDLGLIERLMRSQFKKNLKLDRKELKTKDLEFDNDEALNDAYNTYSELEEENHKAVPLPKKVSRAFSKFVKDHIPF